jgi:hypothetical protein
MKLKDLLSKEVRIKFLAEEASDVIGTLSDIDTETNVIHIRIQYIDRDLFVPLFSVKTISEQN